MGIGLDYCPMTLVSQGGSLRIFEEFPFDRFGLLRPLRRPVLNRFNRVDFHLISLQGPVGVQLGELIFDTDRRFMLPLSMLAIGEETGEMDAMLSKVADFYEDEVSTMVKALTSMIEPIMIVSVGGIVGSILLAMYLPMFSVFEHVR